MPFRALVADTASALLPFSSGNSHKGSDTSTNAISEAHHSGISLMSTTAPSISTISNHSLPPFRQSRTSNVNGVYGVNDGTRILATSKVTCLRKKHRSPRGVNVGELRLTDVALHFKADYMEIAPRDARITLTLVDITMTRMSSYRRMFPYAIHVRSRGQPDYLFAFACARDELTFQQHLQLAIHDANAALSSTAIINRQNNDYPFPAALDDYHRTSEDSLFSSEDRDRGDDNDSDHASSHNGQPRSLPAAKVVNLASLSRSYPDRDRNACATNASSTLTRSKSHPGLSSSSLLEISESQKQHSSHQLDDSEVSGSELTEPADSNFENSVSPNKDNTKTKKPICIDLNSPSIRNHVANRRSIDAIIFLTSLVVLLFVLMVLFISFNQLRLRVILLDNFVGARL